MGPEPAHRPRVAVKLLYDLENLYVTFHVRDQYVLATAEHHQDPVCVDSCVEFFFTPGEGLDQGYFNIEANCGGTVLFNHQLSRNENVLVVPVEEIHEMGVQASMPPRVYPEILDPVRWSVRYRVPYSSLRRFAPVVAPRPGVRWRGNFYKCADRSSHPHWLTWSPVNLPKPDFHQKSFFGTLRFV